MVPEIHPAAFAQALADGGIVVDVRQPAEYVTGHVPGARLMPLDTVLARAGELPTDRPVYVICASGNRSRTAADRLRSRGVDARSVTGGTGGWVGAGRPLVFGPRENAA